MSIKDYARPTRKRYKKKVETVRFELYPTDEDIKARIAERLEAGEGKATYIKRLIRFDIQLHKALAKALQIPPQIFEMEKKPLDYYRGKETLYRADIITDGKVFQEGGYITVLNEEAKQAVMYGNKHATLEEYIKEKEGADGEK